MGSDFVFIDSLLVLVLYFFLTTIFLGKDYQPRLDTNQHWSGQTKDRTFTFFYLCMFNNPVLRSPGKRCPKSLREYQ